MNTDQIRKLISHCPCQTQAGADAGCNNLKADYKMAAGPSSLVVVASGFRAVASIGPTSAVLERRDAHGNRPMLARFAWQRARAGHAFDGSVLGRRGCQPGLDIATRPVHIFGRRRIAAVVAERPARLGPDRAGCCAGACAAGNGFSLREWGYWYTFFISTSEGSLGNTVAGWCHWSQARFGHARGERRRPECTAHNSVRPFENGLRSLGSSATRP